MANPKLEFYRFELNPKKNGETKTFRDFAIEVLNLRGDPSDEKVSDALFKFFNKELKGEHARDAHLQKEIALVNSKRYNKYLSHAPKGDAERHLILGVINGGKYGMSRILADHDNPEALAELTKNHSVMSYFFFLLYLPPDHNEGCFMIHSNSADESFTRVYRRFITKIFRGRTFNKPSAEPFSPKAFQDEFKEGAIVKKILYRESLVPDSFTNDGLEAALGEFRVTITAEPRTVEVPRNNVQKVLDVFAKLVLGKDTFTQLNDFDEKRIELEDPDTGATKTFEWDAQDADFIPSVLLKDKIKTFNEDGTPSFQELSDVAVEIFEQKVLPELRPDHNVTKL